MRSSFIAMTLALVSAGETLAQVIAWESPYAVATAAVASHPTTARTRAEIELLRQRVRSAGTLPNPMVMAAIQNQQIDLTRDEMMTMYMVGASQTLIRSSKRRAIQGSAEWQLRRAEREYDSTRAELERDIVFAWYEVAASDSQIAATRGVAILLDAAVDAARVRYEVGTTIQADVLRAQLERSGIEHQLLTLQGQRAAAATRLASLLGLESEATVPPLPLTHEITTNTSPAQISASHPALSALEAEVQSREKLIELARLASKPDWNLEASYAVRIEQKDMFNLVARVELPYRRKTLLEPRVREAIAGREVSRLQIEELRRRLNEALGVAQAVRQETEEQIRLHRQVLLPQARMALDATLAAYQTGKTTFDAVLASQARYLGLEIDFFEFLARHLQAVADLEAIHRGARSGALSSASGMPPPTLAAPSRSSSASMSGM